MAQATLPLLIEPRDLTLPIDARTTRLVDLCSSDQYLAGHIPGAVHLRVWQSCRQFLPS